MTADEVFKSINFSLTETEDELIYSDGFSFVVFDLVNKTHRVVSCRYGTLPILAIIEKAIKLKRSELGWTKS